MSQTMSTDLKPIPMPEDLEYWTADEVAECLPYQPHLTDRGAALYRKLWRILSEAQNPTPLGGDGSDGTVETPCGRWSEKNDDKTPHWWAHLDPAEQRAIELAYRSEYGG